MENWQAIQNWLVFVPIVGGLAWYYLPRTQHSAPNKAREQDSSATTSTRRKNERDTKSRAEKKQIKSPAVEDSVTSTTTKSGVEQAKKKKQAGKQAPQPLPPVQSPEQNNADEELDMSTKQFAQQMQKARQGQQLSSSKGGEKRVKTVKQGSAMDKPLFSSGSSPADEETSAMAATYNAGDVSDMLEPAAAGPKALRVTAPSQPQKQKATKEPKKEEVETKKQRQNRLKVEERKLQREAEERERKALEEKQRRSAREARGEPAKNGIPVSTAPANNAWNGKASSATSAVASSSHDGPLLDTFDADSSSSSVGGPGASTGPSSVDHDATSEEEQLAQAMQQSVDESGWTTVAVPKKQQKKKAVDGDASGDQNIAAAQRVTAAAPKSAPSVAKSTARPSGFQALEDQYTQRTDVDPNDASNWDA